MKSDPTAEQSIDTVRTVDSEGEAPKRRMATPSACWSAYEDCRNADQKRQMRFGEIAGIFAGFPPTPPQVKMRNGQADMPNINLKQFEAKVRQHAGNLTAITSKGEGWFDVEADFPEDPMEEQRRSKYLTKCFNWAIKKWDNTGFANGNQYIFETATRNMQESLFGIGITFFPDEIDFRWKVIPTRRVLVPEAVRLILDNCPAIFIEDQMSVTELYTRRKKKGWNEKAILRNLYDRIEVMGQTAQRQWTYAQFVQSIRNNDQWLVSDLQPVRFVHTYTMEFDGSISHSIFTDLYGNPSNPMSKDKRNQESKEYKDADAFIYDKTKVAERWQQVWIPVADNPGAEGDYHGVKGFGDMLFDACHLNNLMFNRAAKGAIQLNTLMFSGGSENDIQKLDQVTITDNGILYPGLQLEQVKFNADVNAATSIVGMGTNVMDSNARLFPQNDKTQNGEQPTATQVSFDRADQAQFTGDQIDFNRAVGLDIIGAEMYRRLAQPATKYPPSWGGGEVAEEFRKKCKEFGISEADLLKVKTVRANRNGGTGNMGIDVWKADQLMSVATPGQGQLNARKEKVAALKGWENVEAYVQDAPEPEPEDVQIDNENLFIQSGKTPTAFPTQDHERHLQSHMGLCAQLSQVVAQMDEAGVTPQNLQDALKLHAALDSGIAHSGQHVEFMAEVPRTDKRPALFEQLVKESVKQLHNLQQISQAFGEKIAKASQEQQVAQPSPEMAKAQAEIEIMKAKAQAQVEIDQMKATARLGTDAIKTEAKREMQLGNAQLKGALDVAKTEQQLETESTRSALELQTSAAMKEQEIKAAAAKSVIEVNTAQQKANAATKAARARAKPKNQPKAK
jgi:hypothetical protein